MVSDLNRFYHTRDDFKTINEYNQYLERKEEIGLLNLLSFCSLMVLTLFSVQTVMWYRCCQLKGSNEEIQEF